MTDKQIANAVIAFFNQLPADNKDCVCGGDGTIGFVEDSLALLKVDGQTTSRLLNDEQWMENLLERLGDMCTGSEQIEADDRGDITIIWKHYHNRDGAFVGKEIVNFYYGEPNDEDTEWYAEVE